MTRKRKTVWFSIVAATALVAAACGDGEDSTDTAAPTTTVAATTESPSTSQATSATTTAVPETTIAEEAPPDDTVADEPAGPTLALETSGWPELAAGALYESWLIVDDTPISTGTFNVVDGALLDGDGAAIDHLVIDESAMDAAAIVITIEPANDADPAPSDTHFLAGDLTAGSASLTVDHPAALGTDFADAFGEFVLATPTDGDLTNDEFSGVWFLTFPGPAPGLALPTLPAGWIYEGWTVIEGTPVTTGTFLAVDQSDNEAPYSGTVRTPSFPGEDFLTDAPEGLTFPTDLSGSTVIISVEPLAEDNPAPFAIKPLSGPVPIDAELEPVAYPITVDDFVPPNGIATIAG